MMVVGGGGGGGDRKSGVTSYLRRMVFGVWEIGGP